MAAIGTFLKGGTRLVVLQDNVVARAVLYSYRDGSGRWEIQKNENGEWTMERFGRKTAKEINETLINEGVANV